MTNAISWFELPTLDLARAVRFYEQMLDSGSFLQDTDDGVPQAFFPKTKQGVGGALVKNDVRPSASNQGQRVYLNVNGKLDGCVERVARAGGKVVKAKTSIGPHGYIALIEDSEGNLVGLHSET